ncbi:MAG TPA: formylglycine-generating enzyme family protein [Candidatus Paceibacterota bacterium]|nr:formylglycine-generating enzyme family protein [Candidatus Paceibacterota bacterium]
MKYPRRTPGALVLFAAFGALLLLGGLTPLRSRADVTLQATLTPTVVINGPLGSLQQVQYSTNVADTNSWLPLAMVRMDLPVKNFFDTTANGSQRFYRTVLMGFMDTNLVWIPPGTFLMGSPTNEQGHSANEGPQTQVTLTEGFLMGRYEVRYAEMLAYVTNYVGNTNGAATFTQMPATMVSWSNAVAYCALRTDYERAQGMIPPDWAYRLPTEVEWEYACRAGTTTPFNLGSELRHDAVRMDANFNGSVPYPTNVVPVAPPIAVFTNVGSFAPNAFGLYDMHGNEVEWCMDTAPAIGGGVGSLSGGAITNPVAVTVEGSIHVIRGGHFGSQGLECRSAHRRGSLTVNVSNGFRIVLSPTNAAVLP